MFIFSDDWICVFPASYYNLKSIAAITEGEEDMHIIASPSFKDYYKRISYCFTISAMTYLQMSNDLKLMANCSMYSDNQPQWEGHNLEKCIELIYQWQTSENFWSLIKTRHNVL